MELHNRFGKLCEVEAFYDAREENLTEPSPLFELRTEFEPPPERLFLVRGSDRIPIEVEDVARDYDGHMLARVRVAAGVAY